MQRNKNYVIGIDAGTESCRVGLFDLKGFLLSDSVIAYPVSYPKPGWAEQDAEVIWKAVCNGIKNVVKKGKVMPEDVVGIGLDGTTPTVVPCDENGRPIEKAILWADVRAAVQAERATKTGHEVLKYCGGAVSAESMTAKALWIKENRPKLWKKTKHLVGTTDWLTYKMTGRWTASVSNTSGRWNYVTRLGGWPKDFFEQIGLEDVFEKWPKDVLPMGERQGNLTENAAEQMGLIPRIPIAEGGIDAVCGLIGLDAAKPGRVTLILGSSGVIMINSERPAFGPGLTFICPDVVRKGLWLHCGGEVSTGSVIAWFKNQFAFKEAEEARKKNKRVYEVLDEEAAEIPIGSEGVTVLEHWQGSRIYADPLSRGVIRGLSLNTTRAHIFRAIMEACAYSTNLGLEILRERGVKIEEIRACGGGAASRLLLQIHADVTGLPIYLTEIPEAGSLGSAILGAVAADQYKDLFEACSNMVHVKEKVEPNEENHDNYKFYYEIYKKIYPKMKDLSHEATMHLLSKK